jgi:hypothetical protein
LEAQEIYGSNLWAIEDLEYRPVTTVLQYKMREMREWKELDSGGHRSHPLLLTDAVASTITAL